MKTVLAILFILVNGIISNSVSSKNENNDELIGVAVCYRHGDRAPESSFPNDQYIHPKYWPDGLNQILDKGKVSQFNLGKWLRLRYNGFLSERYSSKEIYVKSSDVDRSIISAASNLAGLYYPKNSSQDNIWPETLPWTPIPIHTVPEADDNIMMRRSCQQFQKLCNETITSEYFQNILSEHQNISQFVESKTGWKNVDLLMLKTLYSVFYVYRMHDVSYLPDWAAELNFDELKFLAGLFYSVDTSTTSLQRLKVGPFFNYFNNYFDGVINGTNPKLLMLSGHDINIQSILDTYGSFHYRPAEFSSMIIWEFYKTTEDKIYLKIFYKQNAETDALEEVRIGPCSNYCLFDDYKNIFQNVTVNSLKWEEECKLNI